MSMDPGRLAGVLAALNIDPSAGNSGGWVSVTCPACGRPGGDVSLRVNVNTGAYACFRCNASQKNGSGDLAEFISAPSAPSLARSTGHNNVESLPPLTEALIAKYHRFLIESPSVATDLERKRGWTLETCRRLNIGWDGSHLWIPIRKDGELVNAKLYDPFRRARAKSMHYAREEGLKRTTAWAPFPESLEGSSEVWMFEGEPDSILAAQMGFPAVVVIGGAGQWAEDLPPLIGARRAIICYDMDGAGRRGSRSIAARLRALGIEAAELDFTLNSQEDNDFTDAIMHDGRDAKWFRTLAAAKFGDGPLPSDERMRLVRLGGGVPGERVAVRAHVLGTHAVPLIIPQIATARCRMNWQPDRSCRTCPMTTNNGAGRAVIDPESIDLMTLATMPMAMHDREYRRILNIPSRCPCVTIEVGASWQVMPAKLIPLMSDRVGGDSTIRAAFVVSPADGRDPPVRANQTYEFHGRIVPDVRSNEWTLLCSESIPTMDDVDSFRVTPEQAERMAAELRPSSWTYEEVERRISEEEDRLARHVTVIYGRRDLHRAVDLTYHSVIGFPFKGRNVTRGWMSVCVIGDSRTGKSEIFTAYSRYIGFGRMVIDPANTTFAGLVGGLQQVGTGDKSWVVTWGLIPTNDRGLVIIDETSSLSIDDIGRMSGMRSSGVAELTKIRSSATQARTRLIMAGNPRGSTTMDGYGSGVEALMDLIGAPEDVARFDYALGSATGLDKTKANRDLGDQPLPIDVGIRRDLVRFAWSRSPSQVEWAPGAEDAVEEEAAAMAARYDRSVPLVEPSEQDLRVARVAVAAAVRTFSVRDDDPNIVVVRECHARFAARTMRTAMDGDLGYGRYSDLMRRAAFDRKGAANVLQAQANGRPLAIVARALLSLRRVTVNTIGMALALDAAEARACMACLMQVGAAAFSRDDQAKNASMSWTPAFVDMLREVESTHVDRQPDAF